LRTGECVARGNYKQARTRPPLQLKEAIRDCGLSLPELSRQTGVSNPQIYRFMSGERSLTLPAAEKLAAFLGLRLAKDSRK
jgi:transcriptional regulator with XRE-family HTH domain